MAERQIVAIGGGATSEAVGDAVLALGSRQPPRLLYVGTASAEEPQRTLWMYEQLRGKAEVSHVQFFPWPPADLRALALAQDVIYVGGGNTANMLAIWRVHGFDAILHEAWEHGVVLAGASAGMICWFEAGVTDSFGPQLETLRDGLGLLPGSACPHYDDEELRRPFYREAVDGGFPAGYAADAGVPPLRRDRAGRGDLAA